MRCWDCGSPEFVTRPNGSRRCAWLFVHGAPRLANYRCHAERNGRSCEKFAGHTAKHKSVVIIRTEASSWWV